MESTLAYSTGTDNGSVDYRIPHTLAGDVVQWDDYCFICSRPTDHAGEHDDISGVIYETGSDVSEELTTDEEGNLILIRYVLHYSYTR